MSIGNPKNDWEQGLADGVNRYIIDPVVERAALELGYNMLMTYEQTILNFLFISELRRKIYPMGL